ncbi:putative DCD domain-containing protein NRP [Dioscorea sansibarensis]
MDSTREFWNFGDQLRRANLAGISIGNNIWSDSYLADASPTITGQKLAFANNNNDRYISKNTSVGVIGINGNMKDGFNGDIKNFYNKGSGLKGGAKKINSEGNNGGKKKNGSNNNSNGSISVLEGKRFKTLPPCESLARNEAVGGYIFVCNNDTMMENLKRQLFGLPPRYKDSVRAITPGLPLFLYNYSTHQLHGIYEAASFGGTNIDPTAWEDKKCPGESKFPAQVRIATRRLCEPLEEDSFRPVLHHYDGPKFRLELSVPEALDLLDKFAEMNA